ncbi:MAG: YitT family protein [Ruminococcaceae bacterium]|nr:YitT family protein [Oscillospiraceae bacterium]
MFQKLLRHPTARLLTAVAASSLMAVGVNLFIVPSNLYTGGLLGLCQILRTLLVTYLHLETAFDLSGILYLLLNVPLFILAWRALGRTFVVRTIICTAANSLFLSLIPVPKAPILTEMLASCMIGGILVGVACGVILTCGCSTGGLDILGLYLAKKGKSFTVGRFSLLFNGVLYTACLVLFNATTAIYSTIFNVFASLVLDRMHQQNITAQVLIFTKDKREELTQFITESIERGVTSWRGRGGYTGDDVDVLCVCLSKFEIEELQQAVQQVDPHAFFVVSEGVRIGGLFQRHLS